MGGEPAEDAVWTITNEFTTIHVRKVFTRNGERLQVHSPKLGFTTELDPLELESLTWQPPETFSKLLETPYGPEDDAADIRPLTELFDATGPAQDADGS
jgi:hypothetical protein